MTLKHTRGDLLKLAEKGKFDAIIQGCNCFCVMGAGLAKEIRTRYPRAAEVDKATKSGDRAKLGTYTSAVVGKQHKFTIINAYTQYSTSKAGEDVFEYDAFERVLEQIVTDYPGYRIGLPYIGMGLANGDAERIMPMIEYFAELMEETGGSVTLVKFTQ